MHVCADPTHIDYVLRPWFKKLYACVRTARSRAKKGGYECTIDFPYIYKMCIDQHFTCAQTGLQFDLDTRSPWGPSIDQVEAGGGYTPDNIQLVCAMYNLAKSTYSDSDVALFGLALAERYEQC